METPLFLKGPPLSTKPPISEQFFHDPPLFKFQKQEPPPPPPPNSWGVTLPLAELVRLEALQTSGKMTRYFLKQEMNLKLHIW